VSARKRVLVVGAKFGEVYLNAFSRDCPGLELAGLLSEGGPRSRYLAEAFGVPLYTRLEHIPSDVAIACIVVRSTIVGGRGTELARACLTRGMHVLQEHPVHPGDIAALQALAALHGVRYRVNAFYRHTPAGRTWTGAARHLATTLGGPPAMAQASTSRQLLYSTLDLLCQATGVAPARLRVQAQEESGPMQRMALSDGHTDIAVNMQTTMDPADPDQHSLIMHQLVLAWPSGYLTLVSSHGPVIWTPALHLRAHADDSKTMRRDHTEMGLDGPVSTTLYDPPASWLAAFEQAGGDAVACCLREFADGGAAHDETYQHDLARLWQMTMSRAARVRHTCMPMAAVVDVPALCAAARSGAA
jgi:thiazolinyl reductase component of yersiniabactin synthetase